MTQLPIRILVHGASGRMGRALLRLAAEDSRLQVVAAVSRQASPVASSAWPTLAAASMEDVPPFDVAIDFSVPEALEPLLRLCTARGAALVSGTTGLSATQFASLQTLAVSRPVVWASNFSIGIVVLEDLVRRASRALAGWQARIVETHHVHKLDAPSGTALTLCRAVDPAMPDTTIESIRTGEVVGEHTITLSGPGEVLELIHRAVDRDIFARGALETAVRLSGRAPGMYRLPELLLADD